MWPWPLLAWPLLLQVQAGPVDWLLALAPWAAVLLALLKLWSRTSPAAQPVSSAELEELRRELEEALLQVVEQRAAYARLAKKLSGSLGGRPPRNGSSSPELPGRWTPLPGRSYPSAPARPASDEPSEEPPTHGEPDEP